ncbi:MAG: hypothetical protein NHB32_31845 [Fischerella sp. CENA71]|nr:hypothetical protein [Fischerella sp. CENA71]
MPSRIKYILAKPKDERRFRRLGESDGWAFYYLEIPYQRTLPGQIA